MAEEDVVKLIIDMKESFERELAAFRGEFERELGAFRSEVRERFDQVDKRLDRLENVVLYMEGRLTGLSAADIQTDRQLTDVIFRQHAQQKIVDDLAQRITKLEQKAG
jgi:hypothetical protein